MEGGAHPRRALRRQPLAAYDAPVGPRATVPWLTILPPVPLRPPLRPPSRLPYPLAEPDVALFARSRHAIWHAVQALGLDEGDEVLVPAFNCGAEVEALLRAGLVCRFFDPTPSLEPDEAELDALLHPRIRALYLIHFLGFPQDAASWRRWCDERGLLLFEDAAQAWLAEMSGGPVGSFGDAAVFSLYKTIGLADGAALVVRGHPVAGAPPGVSKLGDVARLWGRRLGAHPSWPARAVTAPLKARHVRRGDLEPALEPDFELGDPLAPLCGLSRFLAMRLADSRTAERRRANYRELAGALEEHVPAAFRRLPDGASPLGFPVEHRPGLVDRIRRQGVLACLFWHRRHPGLAAGGFPEADRLRASIVILPVHQELRPQDLERIARAAHS